MEKFGYTRKRKRRSRFLLTILMLSTGFSTFSATAWSEKATPPQQTTNYQQLMEAHKKVSILSMILVKELLKKM